MTEPQASKDSKQDDSQGWDWNEYVDRAIRLSKENPAVPAGAALTVAALTMATRSFYYRDSKTMQFWLRARVAAQTFTVAAVAIGMWKVGMFSQPVRKVVPAEVEEDKRLKDEQAFKERLREAEETHETEQMAARRPSPTPPMPSNPPVEAKSQSRGWLSYFSWHR